jgi:hypothetical protein
VTSFNGRRRPRRPNGARNSPSATSSSRMLAATDPVAKRFKWRETYWEVGRERERKSSGAEGLMSSLPYVPAGTSSGTTPMARSPAMVALGDIKQLQQETKRKAQAIDKMVNPPLMADVQLKNQPASVSCRAASPTSTTSPPTPGMKPIYTVMPPVQELMQDIKEIQERIKVIFFNDLFMMFQNLQAEPRSAAAVDARREEKLVMLGPVLERFENEALDPAIDRIFGIMLRGGLLPPPPPELAWHVRQSPVRLDAGRGPAGHWHRRDRASVGNCR